jgi:glutamyl-tRNA synthetase
MGKLSAGPESIDDFIIIKSDGFPTYNFAHIVDDHLMEITHVIRSQEFLPSVPKFLNLYDALNIDPPQFATPPPVLNPDNNRKLSKREGAKQVLDYKKMGILPDAMVNAIVSLGWNDGTTDEFYTREQLIDKFNLSRVQKGGAHFSEDRLFWISGHYIRALSDEQLYSLAKDYLPKSSESYDEKYKTAVLGLIKERLKYFDEIKDLSNFFFEDLDFDISLIKNNNVLSRIENTKISQLLITSREALASSNFEVASLTETLNNLLTKTSESPKVLFSLIRIATTNAPASPGLADTLSLLGRDKSLSRIDSFLKSLSEA